LKEVIYIPQDKKLYLIFEYLELDLKKFLERNKNHITPYQIKVVCLLID